MIVPTWLIFFAVFIAGFLIGVGLCMYISTRPTTYVHPDEME